jgi:hypothetical protein
VLDTDLRRASRSLQRSVPWIIENLPSNHAELQAVEDDANPEAIRAVIEKGLDAYDGALRGCWVLLESRLLGEAVWLVADDRAAAELARDLDLQGDHRLIFTLAEAAHLKNMAEADARLLARKIALVKRRMPGSALRSNDPIGEDA